MIGICKFCDEKKELKKSHAIAYTVFRRILQKCPKNAAVRIAPNENKISLSNDGYAEYQLCGDCESFFNSKFDQYGIYVLREKQKNVKVTYLSNGISFQNVDQNRLLLYFLSVYWRAGLSKQKFYEYVVMTESFSTYLKQCLNGEQKIKASEISIRISKLVDKKIKVFGDNTNLNKDYIVKPFLRKEKNHIVTGILYEGYFFEVCFEMISFKQRNKPGYLNVNKKTLFVPHLDIYDIPEFMDVLYRGRMMSDVKETL